MIGASLRFVAKYWRALSFCTLAGITTLSLFPLPELPEFPGNDKTHHFIAYGALMFPVALRQPKFWLLFAVFFVVWSGAIELIQPYVNRYAEWLDLAANCGGVMLGSVLGIAAKMISSASKADRVRSQ